jgi:hypothetical protein
LVEYRDTRDMRDGLTRRTGRIRIGATRQRQRWMEYRLAINEREAAGTHEISMVTSFPAVPTCLPASQSRANRHNPVAKRHDHKFRSGG